MSFLELYTKTMAVRADGTMGTGSAHVSARSGFNFRLYDVNQTALSRGLDTIRANFAREVAKQKLTQHQSAEARPRIPLTTKLDDLAPASLAIEAATERFEIKSEVFRNLDRILPADAILATNTSSIAITQIAAQTKRPEQVIGMHFFNPVPVMKLVEVIRGLETSPATFDTVFSLSLQLDKTPIEVKDAAGFISNRVLMPLINEALYAVMEGAATAESVDQVFVLGMAHPMGPLTLADFIGLDVCADIMRVLADGLGSAKYNPCPLLVRMVDAGWLGRKSGRGFYTYPAK